MLIFHLKNVHGLRRWQIARRLKKMLRDISCEINYYGCKVPMLYFSLGPDDEVSIDERSCLDYHILGL